MSLKEVKKFNELNYSYDNFEIYFKKENKKYYITVDDNINVKTYEFESFNKAINYNIVKSEYGQMLNLKEIDKIFKYNYKIQKIELKGLVEGKDIFIDYFEDK